MKLPYKLVVLFMLWQAAAFAQTSVKPAPEAVPERKPLVPKTLVVNNGKPNAIIAVPAGSQFQKLGLRVQAAIKAATGAKLEIVTDTKIANFRGELTGQPKQNIIAIGNLSNNGVVAHLYYRNYCTIDNNYPGQTGYVVQTVSDPFGTGVNVIVLGGSNAQGTDKAVDRFCADLPKGSTLNLDRKLKAEYNKYYDASDLDEAGLAKFMEKATTDFKLGKHNGLFPYMVEAGNAYKNTGKEGQAKLFRDLVFLEHDLRWKSPNDFDSPWGGGADMQFAPFMMAWDNVEESPSLSDADRQKIMSIILEYIHYYEKYSYIPYFKTKGLRHNHHTFPGQGFSAAGRYFLKYYPNYADGAKWQEMGDNCFRVQQQSWKSLENSAAYTGLASRHMVYYATTRPDFTWYDTKRANKQGDLVIMTMDNLGSQLSFGDMEGYNSFANFPLWNSLVAVQRNGRYTWALHKARNIIRKTPTESDSIPVTVAPVEPTDLLGLKYMEVDSLFYETLNGTGKNAGKVPRQQSFDKLTFRSSFDPQRQYLCLEGVNIGYHSHRDGNSVLRLTDHGRIWVGEDDYIKASAKYHNMLLIYRDGEATAQPPFMRKDAVADMPVAGISRTTMPDYGGTDWTRNVIWDKERAFIFIDEVKANSTAPYSIHTMWHTLGKPALSGNTFKLTQQGESFAIQNLDGSQMRNTPDAQMGANWRTYPYADPVINSLRQIHSATLRKGDKLYITNVMSAQKDGQDYIAAQRVNDSTLLLGTGKEKALIGVGYLKLKEIEADAQVYHASNSSITLASVSQFTLQGKSILKAVQPISAELTATGLTLSTDAPVKVTLNATGPLQLDKKALKVVKGLVTVTLTAGKHTITGISLPKTFSLSFPSPQAAKANGEAALGNDKLVEKLQYTPANGKGARPLAASASGAYVAGSNGVLYAVDAAMKPRWEYKVGGDVTAVWTGKLGKNDPERIVAGNADGRVVVLNQEGKVVWETMILPYYKRQSISNFFSADLKGDGDRQLIVGSENWHIYAIDKDGKRLWNFLCTRGAFSGCGFDLNGDGKQEVIVATEYYTWSAVNPDNGQALWSIRGGPGGNDVKAADMGGKPMVFMAGADGYLYAMTADGKRPWTYSVGDGATSIEILDVNNDGRKDVIVGSQSEDLYAVDADGKRIWRRTIGEPIASMVSGDMDGDGKNEIVIGTEAGHVIVLNRDGKSLAHFTTSGIVNKLVALNGGRVLAGSEGGKLTVLSLK